MNKKPHIVFLTTSSLATNPRLVKEFEFLKDMYNCIVVSFEHDDWSLQPSTEIIKHNPQIEFITINRRENLVQTLISKLYHKIAIRLNPFFKSSPKIAAYAGNDKTVQLCFELKKVKLNTNLNRVIAHNLGAFYPALQLAKQTTCRLQLDIEDYHPGEEFYFNQKYELQNRQLIMQQAFDKAHAITYASEGIKLKCESAFNMKPQTKTQVIINAFKMDDFILPKKKETSVNFVWFSQNISAKRGLEPVFELAKGMLEYKFHFIGKANENFIEAMQPSKNVIIHKPMTQDKLHEFLSNMDIGLALENKNGDGNRDICLTNKFLAYAQAGLYILATNTYGQQHFMNRIGNQFGVIIKSSLKETIEDIDKTILENKYRIERWEKSKHFSWEKQSELLLEVMK